jgi:hypothetical protein
MIRTCRADGHGIVVGPASGGEAALPPGSVESLCRACSGLRAEPALEEVQPKVDSGADAGCREDRALVDDLGSDDIDPGELPAERFERRRVRRSLVTVKETCSGEQESTGANGRDGRGGRGSLAQERQDDLVLNGCARVGAWAAREAPHWMRSRSAGSVLELVQPCGA